MKSYLPDNAKAVILYYADHLEVSERNFESLSIIEVRRRRWSPLERLRYRWNALMDWTPTDEQLETIAASWECFTQLGDAVLKIVVVFVAAYVLGAILGPLLWRCF